MIKARSTQKSRCTALKITLGNHFQGFRRKETTTVAAVLAEKFTSLLEQTMEYTSIPLKVLIWRAIFEASLEPGN